MRDVARIAVVLSSIAVAGCSAETGTDGAPAPADVAATDDDAIGQTSQSLSISDWGWGDLPRKFTDVNQDGIEDYCRFVGNRGSIFLSCKIGTPDGSDSDEYGYNSVVGIDVGYQDLPRDLVNANNDQFLDWCRFVGNRGHEVLSCNLGRAWGFDTNQYTFNGREVPLGRNNSARKFFDRQGDGRIDFCRVLQTGPYFYCCVLAGATKFGPDEICDITGSPNGPDWAR